MPPSSPSPPQPASQHPASPGSQRQDRIFYYFLPQEHIKEAPRSSASGILQYCICSYSIHVQLLNGPLSKCLPRPMLLNFSVHRWELVFPTLYSRRSTVRLYEDMAFFYIHFVSVQIMFFVTSKASLLRVHMSCADSVWRIRICSTLILRIRIPVNNTDLGALFLI